MLNMVYVRTGEKKRKYKKTSSSNIKSRVPNFL